MVKVEDNEITCTQGDTFETTLQVTMEDGTPYEPAEGDRIRFAIKSAYTDPEPLIVKDIPTDTFVLRIESEETKRLAARRKPYVYDIELTTPGGTVITFIDRQKWFSTAEVH